MKVNEDHLVLLSKGKSQIEGRLQHRGPPGTFVESGFRERFFKLVGNLLFYFRLAEVGTTVDTSEPVGVLILENYSVQPETDPDLHFAFTILFLDEPDRKHVFCARTDSDVTLWINCILHASYQHWKQKLSFLQGHVAKLLEKKAEDDLKKEDASNSNESSVPVPRRNPFNGLPFPIPSIAPPPKPPRSPRVTSSKKKDEKRAEGESGDLIKL